MKTPVISIVTQFYNSESTIEKCLISVLNQTMKDIEWIVLDNGSEDKSAEIVARYAARDSRIRMVRNEFNNIKYPDKQHTFTSPLDLYDLCKGKYFASLDSDDYYDLTFAEKLYQLARKHEADIVACGSYFFRMEDPSQVSVRIPPLYTASNPSGIGEDLSSFYGVFRPIWGKLFQTSTYHKYRNFLVDRPSYLTNGVDTFFSLRFMQIAKRIVCLDQPLHWYMIRLQSTYHSDLPPQRWRAYDLLYCEGIALLEKWNQRTETNNIFLYLVHYHSILDCIDIVCRARNKTATERLSFLKNMLCSDVLGLYLHRLDQKDQSTLLEKSFNAINEIYQNSKGQLFLWFCWLYETFPCFSYIQERIVSFLDTSVLLKSLQVHEVLYVRQAAANILDNNISAAIGELFLLADQEEIPDIYTHSYILLSQRTCAFAEYIDGWVFFQKLEIEYFMEQYLFEKAQKALEELEELLTDDADLLSMRQRLDKFI